MITLLSLRAALHWPSPVSCIQDAFFGALARWFAAQGEAPAFWNVSWSAAKPQRDDAALAGAEWLFLFSSNEFLFHGKNDAINPLFVASSNERVARLKPALAGKRVVLFTMDAKDSAGLIRDVTFAGAALASFDVVSEGDFPLTIQSLRYDALQALAGPPGAERPLDFAYWGTTKRFAPGGLKSGDARFDLLREVMARPSLAVALAGNHFGKVRAGRKFDTNLAHLVPELSRARATCCFQWPGHGAVLTARYHEALALGLIPFVHADYDSERTVACAAWQRIDSADTLFRRLIENRDAGCWRERLAEVSAAYLAKKPSDDDQIALLTERLRAIMSNPTAARVSTMTTVEAAPWQRGFPLHRLRAAAEVFRERHKPLVFGAFGLTKERDIAEALVAESMVWKGPPEAPRALALFHRLKTPGGVTDFAQREIAIPAGSVKVTAFAALDLESGRAVLRHMLDRVPHGLWLEIFEEDEIARACVSELPALQYRATRIAAGSEVKGIYSNSAPGSEPALHDAEQASVVELDAAFADAEERAAMLAEIDAFAAWEQHYSSYNKRQSWTAFALRGFDADDPRFIVKPAEMSKSWKAANEKWLAARPQWTPARERCPLTTACAERVLAGRGADRVRLMKLAPGGELSRHADVTDREAGLADGRLARLHIALRTSEAVIFHGWDKRGRHITTHFREGALCYLDQRGPHRVENRDPGVQRVHLVIDVHSDQRLRDSIAAALC